MVFINGFVMYMGLMNTPAMFMQTMNNLFSNMLDSSMAVFLDDISRVLVHGIRALHIIRKSTGMLTSVYILL